MDTSPVPGESNPSGLEEMTMTRWSYKVEAFRISELRTFNFMLDERGAAGWELVSMTERLDEAEGEWTFTCVFKRPI
jgi:hypothetical protein